MFYESDEGIQIAHFGTGDILVMPGYSEALDYVSVSLADNCGKCLPINEPSVPDDQWEKWKEDRNIKNDADMNTVMRLQFTRPESIDCLIWALGEAKKHFEKLHISPFVTITGYDKGDGGGNV